MATVSIGNVQMIYLTINLINEYSINLLLSFARWCLHSYSTTPPQVDEYMFSLHILILHWYFLQHILYFFSYLHAYFLKYIFLSEQPCNSFLGDCHYVGIFLDFLSELTEKVLRMCWSILSCTKIFIKFKVQTLSFATPEHMTLIINLILIPFFTPAYSTKDRKERPDNLHRHPR